MSDSPKSGDARDRADEFDEFDDDVVPPRPERPARAKARPARAAVRPAATTVDDADAWDDGVEDEDYYDDDDWDEPRRSGIGGLPPVVLIGAAVLVVALVAIFVFTRSSDDDQGGGDQAAVGSETTQPDPDAPQCATWPGIGGLGPPEIVAEPGVHMWSDLKGWHVSRVPGAGVPAVVATVTSDSSEDDPPTPKDATGGATVEPDGAKLIVTLPAGDTASQGNFDIGTYATNVNIIMQDEGGTLLDPEAFTTGGGDKSSLNPIIASQKMQPCDN